MQAIKEYCYCFVMKRLKVDYNKCEILSDAINENLKKLFFLIILSHKIIFGLTLNWFFI